MKCKITVLAITILTFNLCLTQKNDILNLKMLQDFHSRNNALKSNDYKALYFYTHLSDLNNLSRKEFVKDCKKSEGLFGTINEFEILEKGEIIYCDSNYQCMIKLKATQTYKGEVFSFTRKILAISVDGKKWKFINAGLNDLDQIKKLYPIICLLDDLQIKIDD